MNNEPVAWILGIRLKEGFTECLVTSEKEGNADIPLYTHPAKTLTDEEILNLFEPKYDVEIDDEMLVDFARAILKKASEK